MRSTRSAMPEPVNALVAIGPRWHASAERVQLVRRQRTAPAIRLSGHEDDGAATLPVWSCSSQSPRRAAGAEVGGIEQHQRQVGVIHEQRVTSGSRLAREVPEDRLAVRPVRAALAQGGKHQNCCPCVDSCFSKRPWIRR